MHNRYIITIVKFILLPKKINFFFFLSLSLALNLKKSKTISPLMQNENSSAFKNCIQQFHIFIFYSAQRFFTRNTKQNIKKIPIPRIISINATIFARSRYISGSK